MPKKIKISPEKERELYIKLIVDKESINATARDLDVSRSTVLRYKKRFEEAGYEPPEVDKITSKAVRPAQSDEEFDLIGKIKSANQDIIQILEDTVKRAKDGMEVRDSDTNRVIPFKTLADTLKVALEVAKTIETATANKRLTPETIDYEYLAKMYVAFNPESGRFEYDEKKHVKSVLDIAHGKVDLKND